MNENLVNIGEVIVHGVLFDPKNSEALRAMDLNDRLPKAPATPAPVPAASVPFNLSK